MCLFGFLLVHISLSVCWRRRRRLCCCCSILLLSTFVKFFVSHIKYYFLYCILIASIAHNTHAHTFTAIAVAGTRFLEWSTFTIIIIIHITRTRSYRSVVGSIFACAIHLCCCWWWCLFVLFVFIYVFYTYIFFINHRRENIWSKI